MTAALDVRRAASRHRTDQPGITSRHCFSAGAHHDPGNVAFGPLVACDEHLLSPGAGFGAHRHAWSTLISWVLEGTLRHTDERGHDRLVQAGEVAWQRAGSGVGHAEANASSSDALRFVQLWLTDDDPQSAPGAVCRPPVQIGDARVEIVELARRRRCRASAGFLYVAGGRFTVDGVELLAGDSARLTEPDVSLDGDGLLFEMTWP